jgi:hypothetical protein
MNDITKVHPTLQLLAEAVVLESAHQGINIKISECVRTAAEQDAKYAQGRTAPGGVVTNAKGSSYSSMHQWGVACDFYLDMDIDKDGKKSDDAYNDKLSMFTKVGKIGESLGLEWGGDWESITDKPHLQLHDWGSTPTKLKTMYNTPDKFMATWKPFVPPTRVTPKSSKLDIIWLQTQLTKLIKGFTINITGTYDFQTKIGVQLYWYMLGWNTDMKDGGDVAGKSTCAALAKGRKE